MAFKFDSRQFAIVVDRNYGETGRREIISRAATTLRDRISRSNEALTGRRSSVREFVDGVEGAPFDSIKPGGEIRFVFDVNFAIAQAIVSILYQVSPYDPTPDGQPHYRDSHFVIVDDLIVNPPYDEIGDFERMLIINDRVYSNFLEARYAIYESLAFPQIKRLFGTAFRVDLVRDDYFGDRNLGILVRPR